MCDYSLHNVASRPARVGDKLTTRDFGTGTRGFAASENARVAVCVLPLYCRAARHLRSAASAKMSYCYVIFHRVIGTGALR